MRRVAIVVVVLGILVFAVATAAAGERDESGGLPLWAIILLLLAGGALSSWVLYLRRR